MADTGIPLLATLAGFLVAYLFFRHQIRTDRALRRADHRREASTALGAALVKASEMHATCEQDALEWASQTWSMEAEIFQAISRAWVLFPDDEIEPLWDFTASISRLWKQLHSVALKTGTDISVHAHAFGMSSVIQPLILDLRLTASDLLRWDGEGALPGPRSFERAVQLANDKQESISIYFSTRERYENHDRRGGPRLFEFAG